MYKYIGKGFIVGLPAMDLTDAEARAIGLKKIKASGLYKKVKDSPGKPKPEENKAQAPPSENKSKGV